MTTSIQRHLSGQTPFGVFANLFDRVDRAAVGGWYVAFHFLSLRLTFIGMNPRGWQP